MSRAVDPVGALVSAVIIVLDGEDFIEEAIASVVGQSWSNWELIVVDDGSTDATAALVQGFVDTHLGRIRLLRHENGGNHGMSASRNLGVAHASGTYVAFLDADDVWLPTKLEDQVAILRAEPSTAMVYGRTLIWHSWDSGSSATDHFYELGVEPNATYAPPVLFRQLLRNRYQTPTTCNAMVRREVVHAVGGFDPTFADMFEDQFFFAKVLLEYPVHVSDQCWARYRQHQGATSARIHDSSRVAAAQLRYLHALRRHLDSSGHRRDPARLAVEVKIGSLVVGARLEAARVRLGQLRRRIDRS